MEYTAKQKNAIKAHWATGYKHFRFLADGSVEAKRDSQSAWGILYTAQQAASHLKAIGLLKA